MTWAIDRPQRRHRFRRSEAVVPGAETRAFVRPIGVVGIGIMTALAAAWGGIAVFVGPLFGFRPTSSQAWSWTTDNWLLHLVPGAVAVVAGLLLIGLFSADAGRRGGLGFASLLTLAAGAWFVVGPAAWRTFESSAPFAPGTGAMADFANQVGANLGPGLLLAMLGGMAFKAGIARPRVVIDRDPAMAAAPLEDERAMTRAEPVTGPVAGGRMEEGRPMARADGGATTEVPRAEEPAARTGAEAPPVEGSGPA